MTWRCVSFLFSFILWDVCVHNLPSEESFPRFADRVFVTTETVDVSLATGGFRYEIRVTHSVGVRWETRFTVGRDKGIEWERSMGLVRDLQVIEFRDLKRTSGGAESHTRVTGCRWHGEGWWRERWDRWERCRCIRRDRITSGEGRAERNAARSGRGRRCVWWSERWHGKWSSKSSSSWWRVEGWLHQTTCSRWRAKWHGRNKRWSTVRKRCPWHSSSRWVHRRESAGIRELCERARDSEHSDGKWREDKTLCHD